MAHHLTLNKQTGRYEMAFAGSVPWHGLGQRVQQGCTIDEMRVAAGLDWQALESVEMYATPGDVPVTFERFQAGQTFFHGAAQYVKTGDTQALHIASGVVATFEPETECRGIRMRRNDDRKVLFRSDNNNVVGAVGSNYKTVQPAEVLEFFRDLTEAGDWHIHTAGSMHGGSRIWAMASNHTEGEVVPGDRIKGNLLLATSLDGTMKTIAAMTAIRVVCANTLRLALDEYSTGRPRGQVKSSAKKANGTRDCLAISHRSQFDPDAIKAELGLARKAFDGFIDVAAEMADTKIDFEEAREVLRTLFGQPVKSKLENSDRPMPVGVQDGSDFAALLARPVGASKQAEDANIKREQKSVETCLRLFEGEGMGADHPGSQGTRWGLMNAITQHIDHNMGRTPDTRVSNAWFGKGHDTKQQALAMLSADLSTANA